MCEGVHREFYDEAQVLYLIPEQAYQAMPLLAGAVPDHLEASIRDRLLGLIEERGWHMDAGLPGATLLVDLLMRMDEHAAIGKIYAQETYPGWEYMLAEGATTIWEQWNGFWSQIHACFAGLAAWFYAGLAGIRPDESGPGFSRFIISPAFLEAVDFVDARYDSAAGRIKSAWKRSGDTLHWHVTVPAGSSASLEMPIDSTATLSVNGNEWSGEATRRTGSRGDARTAIRLAGGVYDLTWKA